jgi:hypothetical protein
MPHIWKIPTENAPQIQDSILHITNLLQDSNFQERNHPARQSRFIPRDNKSIMLWYCKCMYREVAMFILIYNDIVRKCR